MNNKFEPYNADANPEDGLIDNTPRIAISEVIESLNESDRELVVEHEDLFRELDAADDGDERRSIIYGSNLDYDGKGGQLINIVEQVRSTYRNNKQ